MGFSKANSTSDPLIAKLPKKKTNLINEIIKKLTEELEKDINIQPDLIIAENKKDFKKVSQNQANLVYFEPQDNLYINGNGDDKGFGSKKQGA